MYARSASLYDALYRAMGKNYAVESARVHELVNAHKRSPGNTLLDIACGTGGHLEYLRAWYACEGVDLDKAMLNVAHDRLPEIPLHLMDMIGLNLGKRFDAIVCLFSAIGYLPNAARLDQVLRDFARHLHPGGVAIVEPWIRPDQWQDGLLSALYVDEPDLKVARMSISRRDGNVSIFNFHFTVAQHDGIRTFTEPHRLTLFTHDEYLNAFQRAGFEVTHDVEGLTGRGLYIGTLRS